MQQPPVSRRSFRQWYRVQTRMTKIALACVPLIVVLSLCICTMATLANGTQATQQPTATISRSTATSAITLATTLVTHPPTLAPDPTHRPTPKPNLQPTSLPPTPKPTPTQAHTGVNGNPWGYDFNPGNYIYSPASGFCSYFSCVSTFWTATRGYVVECGNGEYSHSGGVSGACSRDGGVDRPLFSH